MTYQNPHNLEDAEHGGKKSNEYLLENILESFGSTLGQSLDFTHSTPGVTVDEIHDGQSQHHRQNSMNDHSTVPKSSPKTETTVDTTDMSLKKQILAGWKMEAVHNLRTVKIPPSDRSELDVSFDSGQDQLTIREHVRHEANLVGAYERMKKNIHRNHFVLSAILNR